MELQQQVINNYFEIFGKEKTLKEISGHLGIQITRVFRILNGYEMKLTEYEKFKSVTKLADAEKCRDFLETAIKGEKIFSVKMSNEIKQVLEMKIRLQDTIAN